MEPSEGLNLRTGGNPGPLHQSPPGAPHLLRVKASASSLSRAGGGQA